MAQPKKPDSKLARQTTYGELLAGHDMPLGIAAVKAAAAACPPGKTQPPGRHAGWFKGLTTKH
ncbi:MAG TPA: hypothetical protein VLA28_05475 [Afifellaceae bacterium]|nr:hypothetical protein [Afifellaceae bacterium]